MFVWYAITLNDEPVQVEEFTYLQDCVHHIIDEFNRCDTVLTDVNLIVETKQITSSDGRYVYEDHETVGTAFYKGDNQLIVTIGSKIHVFNRKPVEV